MYRYHALGGASLLVLGSALSLVPSTAEAQTALPAVTVEAPRGATGQTCGPEAGRSLVRPDAGEAAFGHPRASGLANRGHHPERGARAALPGADRPDRDDHRSQPVRQPAGVFRGRRAAREPRHLGEAGQRAARYRHLDPRLQRPQRFRHPQPRDLRRRLSGHAAGRAFPQRPDRSARLWRDRRHPGAVVGALRQLCHRRRAQFPHPPGPAPSTASNTASTAAALAISTTI